MVGATETEFFKLPDTAPDVVVLELANQMAPAFTMIILAVETDAPAPVLVTPTVAIPELAISLLEIVAESWVLLITVVDLGEPFQVRDVNPLMKLVPVRVMVNEPLFAMAVAGVMLTTVGTSVIVSVRVAVRVPPELVAEIVTE